MIVVKARTRKIPYSTLTDHLSEGLLSHGFVDKHVIDHSLSSNIPSSYSEPRDMVMTFLCHFMTSRDAHLLDELMLETTNQ